MIFVGVVEFRLALDRCVMSPVWIMKAGFFGMVLMRPIASSSVPLAFGLAGLSKPIWLSLICRNVRPLASAAEASSISPSECGTPPAMVHSTPVPAQVMNSSTLRRLGAVMVVVIVRGHG